MKRRSDSLDCKLTPLARSALIEWSNEFSIVEIVDLLEKRFEIKSSVSSVSRWIKGRYGKVSISELEELQKIAVDFESLGDRLDHLLKRIGDLK